ncbi:hypothetical protein IQ07DRAFT_14583 [Pyrenochaeta sp. DS3sAY3a]|nr:hypothetical protein IQ07DRAFT_14583 [Pyrenochaeta sp. DS3sAY3a]
MALASFMDNQGVDLLFDFRRFQAHVKYHSLCFLVLRDHRLPHSNTTNIHHFLCCLCSSFRPREMSVLHIGTHAYESSGAYLIVLALPPRSPRTSPSPHPLLALVTHHSAPRFTVLPCYSLHSTVQSITLPLTSTHTSTHTSTLRSPASRSGNTALYPRASGPRTGARGY